MEPAHPTRPRPVTELGALGMSPAWVDAAPFRAHLRRLVAQTGEHPRVLALAAGVPPATVGALLRRPASRPGRIRAVDAIRLLSLTPAAIVELGATVVASDDTRRRLAALGSLARADRPVQWFRLTPEAAARLRRAEWCSSLDALRVAAACGAAGLCGWWSADFRFDDEDPTPLTHPGTVPDWAA